MFKNYSAHTDISWSDRKINYERNMVKELEIRLNMIEDLSTTHV